MHYKHGYARAKTARPPEYGVWQAMKRRCYNPNCERYPAYGGRGVTVCERWQSFAGFIEDMGPRPSPKHSIDRIDNNGDYCPENCRWADRDAQTANTQQSRKITFGGQTMILRDWGKHLGISHHTLKTRIDNMGWSIERALTTPIVKGRPR